MPEIIYTFTVRQRTNRFKWTLFAFFIAMYSLPNAQTVLQPGDLAVLSLVSNNRLCNPSGAENDLIRFVCLKDILPGTRIDITDNGWERALPGQWGNSEGFVSFTRTGPVLKAGTVITLQFLATGTNTFQVIAPDTNWTSTRGTPNPIRLNPGGDQVYFMQGGVWNNPDTANSAFLHRATYNGGRILFAINTKPSWNPFINDPQESGLHPLAACLNIAPPSGNWDFLSYTGDFSPATTATWAQRVRNPANWKTFNTCSMMPVLPSSLQILPDSISFHCKSCRGCGPFTDTLSFKLPVNGGPYKVTLVSGQDTLRIPNLGPNSKSPVFVNSTRAFFLASIEDGQGCPLNFAPIPPLTITVEKPAVPLPPSDLSACALPDGKGVFNLLQADTFFTKNKPGFSVSWFLDSTLQQPLPSPGNFSAPAPGLTVYALLNDGFCNAENATRVPLKVLPAPEAVLPTTARLCGSNPCLPLPLELKGKAPFNLAYTLQAPDGTSLSQQQNFTENSAPWNLCLSQPAFQKGIVVLQYQSLTDANGCSTELSGKSTPISVRIPAVNQIRRTLCPGEAIIVNGKLYNERNPKDSVLLPGVAAGACDSLIIIDLSFHPMISANLIGDTSACPGQEFVLQWQLGGGSLFDIVYQEGNQNRILKGIRNGDALRLIPANSTILAIISVQAQESRCEIRPFSAISLKVNDLKAQAQPIPKFGGTSVSCNGASDGEAVLRISGGIAPYRIQWDNGAATGTISGLSAGTYKVSVTDAQGCLASTQVSITQPLPISANLETIAAQCAQESGRAVLTRLSGGTPPFLYSLPGQESKVIERLPLTLRNLPQGSSRFRIQDANGCIADLNFSIPAPQFIRADLGPDQTIASGDSLILTPTFNFEPVQITWSPEVSIPAARPRSFILRPLQTTTFFIQATDSSGCAATDAITIFVEQRSRVFVPGAFSPNGDNINDRLDFYAGPEIALVRSLRIYTRWGAVVFEANNVAPGSTEAAWDGLYKGNPAPQGVYIFQATIEGKDGKTTKIGGEVVLMR